MIVSEYWPFRPETGRRRVNFERKELLFLKCGILPSSRLPISNPSGNIFAVSIISLLLSLTSNQAFLEMSFFSNWLQRIFQLQLVHWSKISSLSFSFLRHNILKPRLSLSQCWFRPYIFNYIIKWNNHLYLIYFLPYRKTIFWHSTASFFFESSGIRPGQNIKIAESDT